MDYPEIRINAISKAIEKPKGFVRPASNVKGNSYYKAKPINKKFPLIIFSHGLGGYKTQNSIAIEALVSNGYIVIAPDHTYDANITIFSNGTSVDYDSELPYGVSAEEFWSVRLPQINTRASDISFIIDKLQTMKNSQFYKSIDFNKICLLYTSPSPRD